MKTTVNKGKIVNESDKKKFAELSLIPVEEQAQKFLRSFVIEFSGSFEEILDAAAEFRKFGSDDGQKEISELDEFQCHRFLEKRGETLTVKALRENVMKELDLDQNHRVSFMEYCLWKYKKTVRELFYEPVVKKREITSDQVEKREVEELNEDEFELEFRKIAPSQELIEELNKAMKTYQEALDVKRNREKKISDLQIIVNQGGVKGLTAKNEKEQLEKQDLLEMNKREITSQSRKKVVQKKIEVYVQEQQKIEEERVKKEEERKKQRMIEIENLKKEEEERQKRELERLKLEEEERVKREQERLRLEKEEKVKQEEERLRLEKEKKEKEEEQKRQESKNRLKQKAALWN